MSFYETINNDAGQAMIPAFALQVLFKPGEASLLELDVDDQSIDYYGKNTK